MNNTILNGLTVDENLAQAHAAAQALTVAALAQAIVAAMNAAPPPVNAKQINGINIVGAGVAGNSFRPAA